jgi:hypothetical protein
MQKKYASYLLINGTERPPKWASPAAKRGDLDMKAALVECALVLG